MLLVTAAVYEVLDELGSLQLPTSNCGKFALHSASYDRSQTSSEISEDACGWSIIIMRTGGRKQETFQ